MPMNPMPDIKMLRTALDTAVRNPDQHDQGEWVSGSCMSDPFPVAVDSGETPPCGTTLCMAGWLAFQNAPTGTTMQPGSGRLHLPDWLEPVWVDDFARAETGLTESQADALFLSARHADDLAAMLDYLEDNPEATRAELVYAARTAGPAHENES